MRLRRGRKRGLPAPTSHRRTSRDRDQSLDHAASLGAAAEPTSDSTRQGENAAFAACEKRRHGSSRLAGSNRGYSSLVHSKALVQAPPAHRVELARVVRDHEIARSCDAARCGVVAISIGASRMSSDVIIGHDGKPRCTWAGTGDTDLGRYHDEVWGTRTHDESAMFEALTLGVFQVGLSWGDRVRKARRVPKGIPPLRRREGCRDDRARRRSARTGRLNHSQPRQNPGDDR
jgi:hypothetical protein